VECNTFCHLYLRDLNTKHLMIILGYDNDLQCTIGGIDKLTIKLRCPKIAVCN